LTVAVPKGALGKMFGKIGAAGLPAGTWAVGVPVGAVDGTEATIWLGPAIDVLINDCTMAEPLMRP